MAYHNGSSKPSDFRCAVCAPVVGNNNLAGMLPGSQDQATDVFLFIKSGHANDYSRCGWSVHANESPPPFLTTIVAIG
jgi:hypothetical protein